MKLPDYHAPSAKWDRYRRFHNERNRWFFRFESGEAIITKAEFEPFERRRLQDSDLRIVLTTDSDCPRFKLDPKAPDYEATKRSFLDAGYDLLKVYDDPVPKTWLQCNGSQTLLIDETTGRTVALDTTSTYRHDAWKHAPGWLIPGKGYPFNAVAYLPGNGRDAVAYGVRLKVPCKPSSGTRSALVALREGCSAWAALADWDYNKWAPRWWATEPGGYAYVYHRPFVRNDANDVPDIGDLSPEQKFQIARFGYETVYKYLQVESLQMCA